MQTETKPWVEVEWHGWVRTAADKSETLSSRHRAFGYLVAYFQDMAFGYAYAVLGERGLAEDAAQEAFIAAWTYLPGLRDPVAFPGWLKRIVLNRCRRIVRQRPPELSLVEEVCGSDTPVDREQILVIRQAVGSLPERERMALLLFHIGQYTREEVAVFLGVSPVAVKKRLAIARARLRERLLIMIEDDLTTHRPSRDTAFARRVLAFTKLFSALIDRGESLVHSLAELARQEEDQVFRAAIEDINQQLQAGDTLSHGLRRYPRFFSEDYVTAIREGEMQGNLEIVLQGLAEGTYVTGSVLIDTPEFDAVRRFSYEEARSRGHEQVESEHLLLALLKQQTSVPGLQATVEAYLETLPTGPNAPRMSESGRGILRASYDAARDAGDRYFDTSHLEQALRSTTARFLQVPNESDADSQRA